MDQKFKVEYHDVFDAWLKELENSSNHGLYWMVSKRLKRIKTGSLGKHKSVGGGVSELKLDYGPGYRIYYTKRGAEMIFLLCAGDKSEQKKDIKLARKLAQEV